MADKSASQQIDDIIKQYDGWKGAILSQLRSVVLQADSAIAEEIKWKTASRPEGLPVWSHNGIVCMAEIWKDNIKLLFPKGALLDDPKKLFNARLNSSQVRAIEFHDGDSVDKPNLQALVLQASQYNGQKQ